jgi:hypothetical protein
MDLGGVVAHVAFRESITSAFLGGEGNARWFAFLLRVMVVPAYVRSDFGTVGSGRRLS